MTDFAEIYPESNYWRRIEIIGRELTCYITAFGVEEIDNPIAKTKEMKPVIHLHSEKDMILNVTNAKAIAKMIRNQNLELAVGTLVTLYADKKDYLRIKICKPNYTAFLEASKSAEDLKTRYRLLGKPELKELTIKLSKQWTS